MGSNPIIPTISFALKSSSYASLIITHEIGYHTIFTHKLKKVCENKKAAGFFIQAAKW